MPKKSSKTTYIRRSGCKSKTVKQPTVGKRTVNNIYIGAENARRWIILKKKLEYQSDVEFVSYLLDLAEPNLGTNSVEKNIHNGKSPNGKLFPSDDVDNESSDSLSTTLQDDDTSEWLSSDELLRRSPRKQSSTLKIHVRRSSRQTSSSVEDKHIRLHQKEKKKKEKREKYSPYSVTEDVSESESLDNMTKVGVSVQKNRIVENVCEEDELPSSTSGLYESDKQSEDPKSYLGDTTEGVNTTQSESVTFTSGSCTRTEWQQKFISSTPSMEEGKTNMLPLSPMIVLENNPSLIKNILEEKEKDEVLIEVGERVKLKRRKKRRTCDSQDETVDENINFGKDILGIKPREHGNKHKKRRHKHGEHSTKKYVSSL